MLSWHAFAARTGAARGVVAVAPHPDDEVLGCGGLIALARRHRVPVRVVHVTDGGASHPGSRAWPPARLVQLRADEARRACRALGVPRPPVRIGLPDGGAHDARGAVRAEAVRRLARVIGEANPGLVVTTWTREPHCDHQAAHALARDAMARARSQADLANYLVWSGRTGDRGALPRPREAVPVTLALGSTRAVKRRALDAHASQLGRVVRDDPDGFVLSRADREAMLGRTETYWL